MYSEYSTIDINRICVQRSVSVLTKLPGVNGPQLVTTLIKPIVSQINANSGENEHLLHCFNDDKDVHWIMEVICYGLSLPLSDNDHFEAVRDCINIYHDWFQVLSPTKNTNKFIPYPIQQDPNTYCQKIIGHFFNIFVSRSHRNQDNSDIISRQALLCHRILRGVIGVVTDKDNILNAETWNSLLEFLLGINNELLKSYVETNDIGTQMADRVISSLFQGWLASCNYIFPPPSMWKTFQNVCNQLRHRPDLVIQWNRVNVCLSQRLVSVIYDTKVAVNLEGRSNYIQYNDIVMSLKPDVLKQCWYRFLHLLGNPIEFCFPEIIFKNDHSKINTYYLPFIFHKAVKGLCTLVDIFLGVSNVALDDLEYDFQRLQPQTPHNNPAIHNATPPEKRKSNFSLLKAEKPNQAKNVPRLNRSFTEYSNNRLPIIVLPSLPRSYYQNHIKLTSILDIFGKWLFQAALICSPNNVVHNVFETVLSSNESLQINSSRRSLSRNSSNDRFDDYNHSLDDYEAGQAEAIGALCRIFCFKKEDEDISLVPGKQNHSDFQKIKNYLTSYYLALKFGLSHINEQIKRQLLSSILVNSTFLFEVDLPGSKILIPHYLKSIDLFLSKKIDSTNEIPIRRACIRILISLLSYPLHYKSLPIKDTLNECSSNTFQSLFSRLILLLVYGLYNETDPVNIQLILGALLFVVEDSVNHHELFSQDNLKDPSNYELVSNLNLFRREQMSYENNSELDKYDVTSSLYLMIISFVAEVLCKTGMSPQHNHHVSLAALEVLSALGRIHYNNQTLCTSKCKIFIKQISTFIENQCYKPAMFHSKDMHSTIVAAYQCLSIWINEHLHLLRDKECIILLFELIELGISGSKSKKENIAKSEKLMKPTSMRVREAAEFLLTTLMSRIDINAASLTDSIVSCNLNESKIIENMLNMKPLEYPSNHFRYFIAENSLLISILDKPLQNEETICIVRSPYGKYCWLFKYQYLTNRLHAQLQNDTSKVKSRILNKIDQPNRASAVSYFPEYYDKMCQTKFDNMVLKLPSYINELSDFKQDHQIMHNLIDEVENNLSTEKAKLNMSFVKKDFQEPQSSKLFEAHRLLLSQFKIFNFDIQKDPEEGHHNLVALNNHSQGFIECLDKLDMISTKNNDFVTIFYIPKGFRAESDLLNVNSQQYKVNANFKEFLFSLGYPINSKPDSSPIFYWSDISHELIFLCPFDNEKEQEKAAFTDFIHPDNDTIRSKLLQCTGGDDQDRIKTYLLKNIGCDIKILVLWMETIEDFDKLPLVNPSWAENEKPIMITIIINPLKNGLFRVFAHSFGKTYVTPIIDRMVLNKQLLASYIRLTALNLFRRRRMNFESFQLPHVKRRMKIQEITNKFKLPYSNKELISDLFRTKFL